MGSGIVQYACAFWLYLWALKGLRADEAGLYLSLTPVFGLMVAIPSMFGYNWLVHNLRVLTVEMDNFAQELAARMEVEFLEDPEADGRLSG